MRRIVIVCIMFLAYWLGIDKLFYIFNRHAKRVICFHHVLPDPVFVPHVNGFELKESDFRRCIKELRRCFRISIDIKDVKALTLTFDDGWKNQFTTAARVLKEEDNIQAILFVAGDLLGNADPRKALTMELLATWLAFIPRGMYKINFKGQQYLIDVPDVRSQGKVWNTVIWPLFRADYATLGADLFRSLDNAFPFATIFSGLTEAYIYERLNGINIAELEELKRRGWKIGWHGRSHYPLKLLTTEAQRKELDAPDFVNRDVLAYPYGGREEVDANTMNIAHEMGYECAFSFVSEPDVMYGRYYIPRMSIPCEKYAMHFTLSGLQYFIKHGRLLPWQNFTDMLS